MERSGRMTEQKNIENNFNKGDMPMSTKSSTCATHFRSKHERCISDPFMRSLVSPRVLQIPSYNAKQIIISFGDHDKNQPRSVCVSDRCKVSHRLHCPTTALRKYLY